jgi:resuscitation-promoting factor RpfA
MSRPSEPFNAEERDLAQRLARLGGPREPAAALDATILAAARAAASENAAPVAATAELPVEPKVAPLRPRKPAPRWPVGFGLAASVVLAAGIGWRLQIDGDTHSEAATAPAADFHEEATEAVILEAPMQRTPPPPPPPLEATDALARRADMAQAPAAKAASAPREPEFAADAAAPQSVMTEAPSPPPPPAPVAAAIGGSPAAEDSLDEVTVTGSRIQRERTAGAAEYTRTPLNERREQAAQAAKSSPPAAASPSRTASAPPPASSERTRDAVGNVEGDAEERKARDKARDSGYDDRPPVSADSPEFRQAWLQRIRVQIAKGDIETARNGLQEFRRRYPDLELPEDLRKLAATLPPPAP